MPKISHKVYKANLRATPSEVLEKVISLWS